MEKRDAPSQPGAVSAMADATTLKSSSKTPAKPKGWKKWTRRLSRVFKGKKKSKNAKTPPATANVTRSPDGPEASQRHKTHKHSDGSTDESPTGSEKDVDRRSTDSREWKRDQGRGDRYSAESCSVREPTDEEWEVEQWRLNRGTEDQVAGDGDEEKDEDFEYEEEELADEDDVDDQYDDELEQEELEQEEPAEDVYEYEEHELPTAGPEHQPVQPNELDRAEPNQADADLEEYVSDQEAECHAQCATPVEPADDLHDLADEDHCVPAVAHESAAESEADEHGDHAPRNNHEQAHVVDATLPGSEYASSKLECPGTEAIREVHEEEEDQVENSGDCNEPEDIEAEDSRPAEPPQGDDPAQHEGDASHTEVLLAGSAFSSSPPKPNDPATSGEYDDVDGDAHTKSILDSVPRHMTLLHDVALWCSHPDTPQTTDARLFLACVEHEKWTLAQLLAERIHRETRRSSSACSGMMTPASAETLLESFLQRCTV